MAAEYGIPYQGSKGPICNHLIKVFPKAENFYDLFGGGFSVTHAMLLRRSKDFKHFYFNEIRPGVVDLIQQAIKGNFSYDKFKPKFISRDEFYLKKDSDPYIKMMWSFGNNGDGYLFSKEIEPYKRSLHNAIVFNEFDDLAKKTLGMDKFSDGYSISDRRLFLRNRIEFYKTTKIPEFLVVFLSEKQLRQIGQQGGFYQVKREGQVQKLERLKELQQLERLQQLQQLQQLERLEFYKLSYEQVPIKENSVVYCDIPYKGTGGYDDQEFNHAQFFDWCDAQKNPVFVSEYDISDRRLTLIHKMRKISLMTFHSRKEMTEKVYANRAGVEAIKTFFKQA